MSSNMLTRRALARQYDLQLKAALDELQIYKTQNEKLLKEREDSEEEVADVVDRNTELKNQLAALQIEHSAVLAELDQSRATIATFDKCADEYVVVLNRIAELESELREAHTEISNLQHECERHEAAHTQNLYEELVGSLPSAVTDMDQGAGLPTVDLTGEDSTMEPSYFVSNKKLKKYIKIRKFIKRTHKLIGSKNSLQKNVQLVKERNVLINKLKTCSLKLEAKNNLYDSVTQSLQSDISRLELALRDISTKYESSKQEMSEQVRVASKLVDMCHENEERFNSLITNHMCSCSHATPLDKSIAALPPLAPAGPGLRTPPPRRAAPAPLAPRAAPVAPAAETRAPARCSLAAGHGASVAQPGPTTVIYSDEIGAGFGAALGQLLRQKVINHCLRGATLQQIAERLLNDSFDTSTTLIIMLGNSIDIKKSQLEVLLQALSNIEQHGIGKIILCALPYSKIVSDEHNNSISKINAVLYNATCYNCNYHFFDSNKFIKHFRLYRDRMYLSRKCRLAVAKLLAFNIEGGHSTATGGGGAGAGARAPRCVAPPAGGQQVHLN